MKNKVIAFELKISKQHLNYVYFQDQVLPFSVYQEKSLYFRRLKIISQGGEFSLSVIVACMQHAVWNLSLREELFQFYLSHIEIFLQSILVL